MPGGGTDKIRNRIATAGPIIVLVEPMLLSTVCDDLA